MATPVSGAQSPSGSGTEDQSMLDDPSFPPSRLSRARGRHARRAMSEESGGESTPNQGVRTRGPGRPRIHQNSLQRNDRGSASVVPADVLPEEVSVENDELVLSQVDEDGERKVDDNGRLFGEREYRVRTFPLLGRGQRLYMLSTEPARCMGYRDSYLFFLKHKTLHRVILDDQEKEDLAQRDIIPMGYRTRQLAVCTARSVFREFGARAVIGGRRIIDDYWVKEYRSLGYEEGTIADPDDRVPPPGVPYNMNQFVAWHGASSVYHQTPMLERRAPRRVIDDVNWITAHAQAASSYNDDLSRSRRSMLQGVLEPHTAQLVYPAIAQPQRCQWQALPDDQAAHATHSLDVRMVIRPCQGNGVRLLDVDESVFASASPEVKAAIMSRRAYEQSDRGFPLLVD